MLYIYVIHLTHFYLFVHSYHCIELWRVRTSKKNFPEEAQVLIMYEVHLQDEKDVVFASVDRQI